MTEINPITDASSGLNTETITVNVGIVFIDPSVSDHHSLMAGVAPGAEVFVLDSTRDGVEQITEVLAGRSGVSSVHIVSHGGPGSLQLGKGRLSLDTLNHHAPQLQTWFSPCSSTLHLYACNLAAGDTGAEFLTKLYQLTGASIAASVEVVGNLKQGGTWQLTAHRGTPTPEVVFDVSVTQYYTGVFALSFGPASKFGV